MIVLKIENNEFNMPESWNEVSLEKFEKIINLNSRIKEYKSQILFGLEIFSTLIGCDVETVKRLSRESFEVLTKETMWLQEEVKGVDKEEFEIEGDIYRPLRDLNKIKMGDSISLELVISESTEANLLINILPILLRKVKKVKDEKGNIIETLEDFDPSTYNERKNIFMKNLYITDVINFKHFF